MAQHDNDAPKSQDTPRTSEVAAADAADTADTADTDNSSKSAHEHVDRVLTLKLKLPAEPFETKLQISTQEQVQDVRQSIIDQPFAMQYSCFHLEHNGERINDFIELSDVKDVNKDSVFTLVEDPYTEKDARMHILRIRELIGAASERIDAVGSIHPGASLHDAVIGAIDAQDDGSGKLQKPIVDDLSQYQFNSAASATALIPREYDAPRTIKSIALSPWNPPPAYLRSKGHLLYLVVINLEGEQFHITSHVSGFYVNRSSHNKFDPSPKGGPKTSSSHSLLTLLHQIDPKFNDAFQKLLEYNSQREPLALFSLTNALPANPWLVSSDSISLGEHKLDITRTQESYLNAGADNNDNLRDWNEEFQSTRELPVETVQDRVFRERLTSKLFADFNEAAVKGAVLVARGEIPPLNPTEARDAQIFVHNNVFFSFGADGVGTFATEGGDEAARVATGKDVAGVQLVNQLDISGLFTAGSVIIDYLGKRIVGQSIVPGIFRQKEPDENQIDYGGVEGKDVIAENENFVKPFAQLSKATHVKQHPVWDKEGKRHDLEASVDTKGLLGTDGRKYVLDLYRLTPLDVNWIEQHWAGEDASEVEKSHKNYPHRMTTLRPELIAGYRLVKLREFIDERLAERAKSTTNGKSSKDAVTDGSDASDTSKENGEETKQPEDPQPISTDGFDFSLNPDVFAGQNPQSEEETAELAEDERKVRAVCEYLTAQVIPKLVQQLQEGDVGFPIDGESLTGLLHKRGINVRYLGSLARHCDQEQPRLKALHALAVQEMVARSVKHIISKYMRHLPVVFTAACMAHILNCLLGAKLNDSPVAEIDDGLRKLYGDADFSFEHLTPQSLSEEVKQETFKRFRFDWEQDVVQAGKELQLLREIALKVGPQLVARDYAFEKSSSTIVDAAGSNGASQISKKRKKGKDTGSPPRVEVKSQAAQTFYADDIVNFVPVVKGAAPKSALAEEAFEGGRLSLAQDQREIGQELLLESLTLHEQIYGLLHPEVARMYLSLSNIYYSMGEKNAAAELARKAVVIAERTLGLDASETILSYLNLALFEHACDRSVLGLKYILHAIELSKIAYGANHPDSITILNNGAVMLQSLKRYHESRIWFEASLAMCDQVAGKGSINTATLLFQLAQALALDQDHRAAVNRMRESCNLFRSLLGADDRNTKEAETWLEQLTQNAVSVEKRAKIQALTGRVRQSSIASTIRPLPRAGQSRAEASGTAAGSRITPIEDKRSIQEIMDFINGKENTTSKSSSRKKRGNPKNRGGANVSVGA